MAPKKRRKKKSRLFFSVEFPTKPYIIKYFSRVNKIEPDGVIRHNTTVGRIFLLVATTKPLNNAHNPRYYNSRFPNMWRLKLPEKYGVRYGYSIEPQKVVHANLLLDELFKLHYMTYVREKIEEGTTIQNSILGFMDKYELGDQHIQYQTLQRYYTRHK